MLDIKTVSIRLVVFLDSYAGSSQVILYSCCQNVVKKSRLLFMIYQSEIFIIQITTLANTEKHGKLLT